LDFSNILLFKQLTEFIIDIILDEIEKKSDSKFTNKSSNQRMIRINNPKPGIKKNNLILQLGINRSQENHRYLKKIKGKKATLFNKISIFDPE